MEVIPCANKSYKESCTEIFKYESNPSSYLLPHPERLIYACIHRRSCFNLYTDAKRGDAIHAANASAIPASFEGSF